MDLTVLNIDTPTLGDRSYLVHDGKTAAVIDPQRDVDRVNEILSKNNLKLGAVVETHMHNDYVSGGLELSRAHSAPYLINKEDEVSFDRDGVVDQQVVSVGTFALKVMKTPGHTFTHLSFQLLDWQSKAVGVFTGGSMLHGATGRPDLLGWNHARELAGLQHDSANALSELLTDDVKIYPTHGFGSFCSATPTVADSSTMADEKKTNSVLLKDRNSYVESTLAALDAFPTYFKLMGPANSKSRGSFDLSELVKKSSDEILRAIQSGAWVVDLRTRSNWAREHIDGSTSLGLDGSLASYLGWLYPFEKDLFLFSDRESDLPLAQRELVRIGIDRPTGSYVGNTSDFNKTSSIKLASFSDLPAALHNSNTTMLDVRQIKEREKSFIEPSLFIPFYEVASRVGELPETGEIWVHCASGYRAASIIGFIESSGRTPVLIDDDYDTAATVKGLKIISESSAD